MPPTGTAPGIVAKVDESCSIGVDCEIGVSQELFGGPEPPQLEPDGGMAQRSQRVAERGVTHGNCTQHPIFVAARFQLSGELPR
jgi:hypothetical protein